MHTYTHTHIHAYMHTCIHAYMQTCKHAYMHTEHNIQTYIHRHINTYMHACIIAYMHTYIHTSHTSHTCIQAIPLARNRYSGACGQRPKRLQMMLDTCHSARCECNTVRKHERRLFLLCCPSSQCCPERKQVKLLQQRLRRLAELRAEDLRCRGLTPPTRARCPESLAGPAAH